LHSAADVGWVTCVLEDDDTRSSPIFCPSLRRDWAENVSQPPFIPTPPSPHAAQADGGATFAEGNSVWVRSGYTAQHAYREVLRKHFAATVETLAGAAAVNE
jgi:hypothetical protein